MLVHVPNNQQIGIVRDLEAYTLPAGAWSDGLNMLFKDQKAQKAFGSKAYLSGLTTSPKNLFFCPLNETGFWIYPSTAKIRAFDISSNLADITRASGGDYTGTINNPWRFCYLNGVGILTNGVDTPQQWSPGLGNTCAALSNWLAAPNLLTARNIRAFKNFLIALDVTKTGGRYSQLVKWSHPADPGTVPSSWDETDTTKLTGEFPLTKTPGIVLDCLPLGNSNIVYKEDAVWAMNFIGGQSIFGFNPLFESFGLLAPGCAVEFLGQHFVVTRDDVVVHNGSTVKSILDERDRKWLFANLEPNGYGNDYAFLWTSRGEIWFIFATTGQAIPTMAMIYNIATGSITFRQIPSTTGIAYTPPLSLSSGDTWDGDTTTQWGGDSKTWDDASFTNVTQKTLFVNATDDTIHQFDETLYQDAGVNYQSYLQREDLPFIGMDNYGQPIVDLDTVKFIKEIYPRLVGDAGTTVQVYFAVKEMPEDTLTWQGPFDFTIGTTQLIDVYQSGRFFSVKFQDDNGSSSWSILGFSYDVEPLGRF